MTDTKSHTTKDFYASYKTNIDHDTVYDVDYKVYKQILIDYFKFLRDEVIENSKEIRLPCRLGYLSIIKKKPKTYTSGSLRVDYHATKQYGKVIYHLNEHSDGYKYRAYWSKKDSLLTNKTKYQFVLTRYNKRRLAQIIKNREHDFVEIY